MKRHSIRLVKKKQWTRLSYPLNHIFIHKCVEWLILFFFHRDNNSRSIHKGAETKRPNWKSCTERCDHFKSDLSTFETKIKLITRYRRSVGLNCLKHCNANKPVILLWQHRAVSFLFVVLQGGEGGRGGEQEQEQEQGQEQGEWSLCPWCYAPLPWELHMLPVETF